MAFSASDAAQVATLRDYIVADTPGIGLSFATKTDVQNAALMNGASVAGTVTRSSIAAHQLLLAVEPLEYVALPAAQRQLWTDVLAVGVLGGLDLNSTRLQALIGSVWGAATTTRANLLALRNKSQATYAETLFGEGTRLDHLDVAIARAA